MITETQKEDLLKRIVAAIDRIKELYKVEMIKDYELPSLVNMDTKQDIGIGVKLQLNTRYTYNEFKLTTWKRLLNADDWYIKYERNHLYVTFTVLYKH